MTSSQLIWLILGMAGGAGLAAAVLLIYSRLSLASVRKQGEEILQKARDEGENAKKQALLDAREQSLKDREALLREVEKTRSEVRELERDVEKRERTVVQKGEALEKRERTLESAQRKAVDANEQCERRKQTLDRVLSEQRELLHRITNLSKDEAEKLLLSRIEDDFSQEIGEKVMRFEQNLKSRCEQKAKEILATAIQRYAAEHVSETTTATITLPNDDMKGRIIGREGRNIRAFEKATGVDVIVDDTPGVVVVSGFDAVRREVGKIALEKLLADGRIHPSRIEEVVAEVRDELEQHIVTLGQNAALEADVPGLHERIVQMLGRLKFRTSYSQNVLNHSVEVALLCGLLAEEMGLDPDLARRCGLLHDIGKAADHEMEGGHPKIGADVARRCGENEAVIHAIGGHHDDIRVDHIYTVLVATADAISASRPGARRETLEKYVKRLEELEAVACEFPGVETAYAIQAGREVRVIADSGNTSDKTAAKVCRDIARAIESRLKYPGEIKVTVVRETRTVEYAR